MMATKKGIIKKTELEAYSRPKKGGIIAIKLREDDELVDVVVAKPNDQIVLSTANGMAIRFAESNARSMGRNTSGVKGISLKKGDELVGMVVADPTATLLTVCELGYGKRTTFGPGDEMAGKDVAAVDDENADDAVAEEELPEEPENEAEDLNSANRYRTQRRGGKGVIDIKTTKRNGRVVGIVPVSDGDELMMMTVRGKIQRVAAKDISVIGRNTQGVRIMSLDEGDTLTAIVRVPPEDISELEAAKPTPVSDSPSSSIPTDDESVTDEPMDDLDSGDGDSDDEGQS
jgi:DNA gyrase subunit A